MLINLNDPGPQWLPPAGHAKRRTPRVSGVAAYLNTPPVPAETPVTRTVLQEQVQRSVARKQKLLAEHQRQFQEWKAQLAHLPADPNCTVVAARLGYSTTSEQISAELSKYGAVSSVRVIKSTTTGAPRGYAFVVFGSRADARSAIEQTNGQTHIDGRRVVLDLERARTQRSFRPRRLGGGEGGRFTVARERAEAVRAESIRRYGIEPRGRKRTLGETEPRRRDMRGSASASGNSIGGGAGGSSGSNGPARQLRQY